MKHLALLAAFSALATAPASALDLPARKAGLWEIKMTFEGRNLPPQAMQHCTDAETDKLMNGSIGGTRSEMCPQHDMQKTATGYVVDSVCKIGEATTTSHAVVTGSFDSAYTIKVASKREGGRQMPGAAPGGETHMTIEAKWLGACKAGQKAGDIVTANGRTMNVRDLPRTQAPPR